MLIIGAKGLAKEVLEIFHQKNELENLYFYDNISKDIPDCLYERFPVLKNTKEVLQIFKKDNRFTLGLGNPLFRLDFYKKFKDMGGILVSVISPSAQIGHFGTMIGDGCTIMAGNIITNDVHIGVGCLINPNCTISHDSLIGNFVEISPGVQVTGNCVIGDYCSIGTGAIILPKIKLGNSVVVGAGAVVRNDVPEGQTVIGIPAKVLTKKE